MRPLMKVLMACLMRLHIHLCECTGMRARARAHASLAWAMPTCKPLACRHVKALLTNPNRHRYVCNVGKSGVQLHAMVCHGCVHAGVSKCGGPFMSVPGATWNLDLPGCRLGCKSQRLCSWPVGLQVKATSATVASHGRKPMAVGSVKH